MLCDTDKEFLTSFEHTTKSIQYTGKRFDTWGEVLAEIINMKIQIPKIEENRLKLKESTNG